MEMMKLISIADLLEHPNDYEYAFLVMSTTYYKQLEAVVAAAGVNRSHFKKVALLGIKDSHFNGHFDCIYVVPDFYELMRWAKSGNSVIAKETCDELQQIMPPPDHVYVYEDMIDEQCKTMAERVAMRKEYRDYNNQRDADLNAIRVALDEKAMYNLNVEVLYSAFESIKSNPKRSIADAIADGIDEWVK